MAEHVWSRILLFLPLLSGIDGGNFGSARLCGDDHTTRGRCFVIVNQRLSWLDAIDYCQTSLGLSPPGSLATIDSQSEQELVTTEASRLDVDHVWINGYLRNKKRQWTWFGHSAHPAYQGCWPTNGPVFPHQLTTSPSTKPSDCLSMCSSQGYTHMSVTVSEGIRCRCGNINNLDSSEPAYHSHCDTTCNDPNGQATIDLRCPILDYQLIYRTGGTLFQAFASSNERSYSHCVVFDHNLNHKWAEHSCRERHAFICEYDLLETMCNSFSSIYSTQWVAGVCVTLESGPKDFYEAALTCRQSHVDQGRLLAVREPNVDFALRSLLDQTKSYFIALTDEEWIRYPDGQLLQKYYNWGGSQPNDDEGKSCLKMVQTDNYKWYNSGCNNVLPFACVVDIEGSPSVHITSSDTTSSTSSAATNDVATTPTPVNDVATILTTTTQAGLSKDLIIGVSAGAGGAFLIVLIGGLCICFFRRMKKQKTVKRRPQQRARPRPKQSLPRHQQQIPAISQVYLTNEKQYYDRPYGKHAGSSRSNVTYDEINDGYSGLQSRRSNASHTYDKLDGYDYIEPIDPAYSRKQSGSKSSRY